MFSKAKNINSAFQYIRTFSLFFLTSCTLLTGFVIYRSLILVSEAQKHIYILANGKALEAFAADRKDNIPVEARDHISMFHHYFFTLDPDEKVINGNMGKALYLADASAKKQYDNLKENGYYRNIISGNISQTIEIDTIGFNMNVYPYSFHFAGREKIVRTTSIVTRSLVTEGYLRNVSRSDNNSHGFLIENWAIIENKDIRTENR
ncbi:MAG TPA: conjugative transposon protein TraK [Puia sp.]|jgi:conjugative transposon TraK protein|nr:conjugative transposon protein TraK [Puia sp.]